MVIVNRRSGDVMEMMIARTVQMKTYVIVQQFPWVIVTVTSIGEFLSAEQPDGVIQFIKHLKSRIEKNNKIDCY